MTPATLLPGPVDVAPAPIVVSDSAGTAAVWRDRALAAEHFLRLAIETRGELLEALEHRDREAAGLRAEVADLRAELAATCEGVPLG